MSRKRHWERIYRGNKLIDLSWYQPVPQTSLDFIQQLKVPTEAKIIDIGGGDSFLVDHLLDLGYYNITVLDISETAIEKAKTRLGERAIHVKWVVGDIVSFVPTEKYDFWHDRATLHFLTDEAEIEQYVDVARQSVKPDGIIVVGTFSIKGPKKCSGIEVKQYSEISLAKQFQKFFEKIKCICIDHKTPSGAFQNFIFCSFRKILRPA